MKRIYLPQARRLLAEAVETQGRDFVYNNSGKNAAACMYFPNDAFDDNRSQTGCLIGTALKKADVPVNILHTMSGYITSEFSVLTETLGMKISKDALDYLQVAQAVQDRGASWGEAFDLAERSIEDKQLRREYINSVL